MLAIIGGSGLTQLANLEIVRRQVIRTPYGDPSGALSFGRVQGREVVFLARHGYGHTIAPHEINYRANMWALHDQGVTHVLSVASVGGIPDNYAPGTLVVPDQIIDYTYDRKNTYFEGSEAPVTHIDFTEPYCEDMRNRLITALRQSQLPFIDGGTYAALQGPRLETKAEINRLERDGATMVGMTGMPEAALAREIGLCYAAIAVVANYAAGRGDSAKRIEFDEITRVLDTAMDQVRSVLEHLAVLEE